jgi:osomolarity two-component system response regulator SKN7
MQEGVKYDMILMDIIMPNLDGVSACHIIRQFDRTPIVAMTSNIRSDDIQMYFQHGELNPVLIEIKMTDATQEWMMSCRSPSHVNHY